MVVAHEPVEVGAVVERLRPDREASCAPGAAPEQVPPDVGAGQVHRPASAVGEVARVRLEDAQRAGSLRAVRGPGRRSSPARSRRLQPQAPGSGRPRACDPPSTEGSRTVRILHVAQPTVGGLVSCVGDPVADQVGRGWNVWVACPPEGDLLEVATRAGASFLAVAGETVPRAVIGRGDPFARRDHPGDRAGPRAPPLVEGRPLRPARAARAPADRLPAAGLVVPCRGRRGRVGGCGVGASGARWAHALVCASETERADGERAGIEAAWRVIYNGVDVERLSAVGEEEQRGPASGSDWTTARLRSASDVSRARRARTSCSTRGRPSASESRGRCCGWSGAARNREDLEAER